MEMPFGSINQQSRIMNLIQIVPNPKLLAKANSGKFQKFLANLKAIQIQTNLNKVKQIQADDPKDRHKQVDGNSLMWEHK